MPNRLAVDAERPTTCGQHGQALAARQQFQHEPRTSGQHVLAVVEHEKDLLPREAALEGYEKRFPRDLGNLKRPRHGSTRSVRVRNWTELDPSDSILKARRARLRYLASEPRLARPRGARYGHETLIDQELR